jgi:hypothetical protein
MRDSFKKGMAEPDLIHANSYICVVLLSHNRQGNCQRASGCGPLRYKDGKRVVEKCNE